MSRLFPHSSLMWVIKAVLGGGGVHFIIFEMGSIDVPEINMQTIYQFERELYLHGCERLVCFQLAAFMSGAIRFKMGMTDFEKKYN